MASQAQLNANKRYLDTKEEVRIWVSKGKRDEIKKHAASKGCSVNAYIKALISADMGGITL